MFNRPEETSLAPGRVVDIIITQVINPFLVSRNMEENQSANKRNQILLVLISIT